MVEWLIWILWTYIRTRRVSSNMRCRMGIRFRGKLMLYILLCQRTFKNWSSYLRRIFKPCSQALWRNGADLRYRELQIATQLFIRPIYQPFCWRSCILARNSTAIVDICCHPKASATTYKLKVLTGINWDLREDKQMVGALPRQRYIEIRFW